MANKRTAFFYLDPTIVDDVAFARFDIHIELTEEEIDILIESTCQLLFLFGGIRSNDIAIHTSVVGKPTAPHHITLLHRDSQPVIVLKPALFPFTDEEAVPKILNAFRNAHERQHHFTISWATRQDILRKRFNTKPAFNCTVKPFVELMHKAADELEEKYNINKTDDKVDHILIRFKDLVTRRYAPSFNLGTDDNENYIKIGDTPTHSTPFASVSPIHNTHNNNNKSTKKKNKKCCACCGAEKASSKCARCQNVYYCNRQCQTKHWPQHKLDCKAK